jgi:hypothetical protein
MVFDERLVDGLSKAGRSAKPYFPGDHADGSRVSLPN